MNKKLSTIALTVMCALFFSTCGGGSSNPPPGATPDFTISVNPGTVSGSAGGNTNATTVSVTGLNGFNGNVIVSIIGLLPGSTTSPPQPFAVAAGGSQALSIGIPAGAAQGNVALTLTGTAGQRTHSVALVLSVGPTPGPDFSIAANPGTIAATPGGSSAPANVSVAGTNGFAGNVSVSLTGLPAGATTTPAQPFNVAAGASQPVTINVPANVAPGSVGITVTGTSGQLAHSTALVLNVGTAATGSDQIVVIGQTDSSNFPTTPGALAPNPLGGNGDGTISSVRLANGVASTTFSTYFGGNGAEQIRDVFVDSQGNIYVTGHTSSTNLPTTAGVVQRNCNNCATGDAFVAVLSPSGQVLRATYLGGSDHDEGYNIFVDSTGAIYVGGRTASADYPVTGAQISQRTYGGGTYDMHVTKLSADLSTIVWATFIGGSGEDTGRGRLALDGAGNIYMSGETRSNNFPGAVGQLTGTRDGVVVKLSPSGARLYSRLIGGNEGSNPESLPGGLLVKNSGEVYACGLSSASDVPGVIRPFGGGQNDALIARLDSNGQIMAITYLGGNGADQCHGLALDPSGDLLAAVLSGSTSGIPVTAGVFQIVPQGGTDYVFTKFSPDLTQIRFSTFVGGTGNEGADTLRLELDSAGNIYFAGFTASAGLPWITANAVQGIFRGGSHDYVMFVLSPDGRQILYASYLGGNGTDLVRSMRYHRNP